MNLPHEDPTASQLAELVGVPTTTFKYWINTFNLKPYRDSQKRYRFLPPAVEAAKIIAAMRKEGRDGELIKRTIQPLIEELPEPPAEVEILPPEPGDEDVYSFQTTDESQGLQPSVLHQFMELMNHVRSWDETLRSQREADATQLNLLKELTDKSEGLSQALDSQTSQVGKRLEDLESQNRQREQTLLEQLRETQNKLDAVQAQLAEIRQQQQVPWYQRLISRKKS